MPPSDFKLGNVLASFKIVYVMEQVFTVSVSFVGETQWCF